MIRHAKWALCGLAALYRRRPGRKTTTGRQTMLELRRCRMLEIVPEGVSTRRRCPGLAG